MSSSGSSKGSDESSSIFNQPWGTTWRKAIVSLPRLVPDAALRLTSPGGPQPIVVEIPSRGKHKIPLYIFIPPKITTDIDNNPNQNTSCPVLLDFHGGSFVFGSCQEQAPFCAKLCRDLGCIAISVDYRLGPAAKFPAALEDAEDVLNAILHTSSPGYVELRRAINSGFTHHQQSSSRHGSHENHSKKHAATTKATSKPTLDLDTTHIALSGFSSGGNLAMNLALSLDRQPPQLPKPWPSPLAALNSPTTTTTPTPLLLFYPALDTRLLPHERPRPAGLAEPKGFFTSLKLEADLMPTYLPRHMATHPRASPCLVALSPTGRNADGDSSDSVCRGTLHASAKAYIVLPEFDAITAQSETWVKMVEEEGRGGDLEVVRVPGVVHGWTQFPDPWLDEDGRKKKTDAFAGAVKFVQELWKI